MKSNGNYYREFEREAIANGDPKALYRPVKVGGFEWADVQATGTRISPCTISELSKRPSYPLRIVFAPLDLPNPQTVNDMLALYKLYSIPDAFVSERLHHVAHSFGTAREREGCSYSWFHFLCKNIPVEDFGGVKYIVNKNERDAKDLSQADFTWVRSAYCMKTNQPAQSSICSETTLIVFGGEVLLWEAFDSLASTSSCQDILEDPYCLMTMVFEVLYARIDRLAWDLARVYSQEEEKILRSASHPGSAADALDFVGLHMLSKYQIYLLEATEAVRATLDTMKSHHERITQSSTLMSAAVCETRDGFRHRGTLFRSTHLRLKSLDKRTQNMINLSFNLVTQADSRIMKADSRSVKTIAAMTLGFLPCTAVATVFSTPFFYLHDNNVRGSLGVSPYFWLIWVISVPLTALVIYAWIRFQKRLELHLAEDTQPMTARETV